MTDRSCAVLVPRLLPSTRLLHTIDGSSCVRSSRRVMSWPAFDLKHICTPRHNRTQTLGFRAAIILRTQACQWSTVRRCCAWTDCPPAGRDWYSRVTVERWAVVVGKSWLPKTLLNPLQPVGDTAGVTLVPSKQHLGQEPCPIAPAI